MNTPTLINQVRDTLDQNMPSYLDMLRQMVDINSFTSNPDGINHLGDVTANFFARLGFEKQQIQSANPTFGKHLVMVRPGLSERKIGLISHLDTVFSEEDERQNDFCWRPVGNRIYGPGTVDIKGGTVLIYMALEMLQKFAPQSFEAFTWVVLCNASEETISVDFGDLVESQLGTDGAACLIFEGGRQDGNRFDIVTARKGMANYHVTVAGKAGHAGNAHENGANALVELARIIDRVASYTDYSRALTFNPGWAAGGTVTNRVPHFAEARFEMRTFDKEVFKEGVDKMLALCNQASVSSADGFTCKVDVSIYNQTQPWQPNPQTMALFDVWRTAGSELGFTIQSEERGGLSDGNLLWEKYPTLDGLGPAGGNAHCSERSEDGSKDQEYVLPSSFVPKTLVNLLALNRLVESLQM